MSNLDNDGDTQVLSRIEEPFVMWRKVFKHTRFYFFIVFVIFKLDRDEHNVVQLPWFNFKDNIVKLDCNEQLPAVAIPAA